MSDDDQRAFEEAMNGVRPLPPPGHTAIVEASKRLVSPGIAFADIVEVDHFLPGLGIGESGFEKALPVPLILIEHWGATK